MGKFSPPHWIVLLAIIGTFAVVLSTAVGQPKRKPADGLYGIRGWLLFFVVALGVINPLMQVASLSSTFFDSERAYPALRDMEEWGVYKDASWGLHAGLIAWQGMVVWRLVQRFEPKSVFHAKVLLLAEPLVNMAAAAFLGNQLLDIDIGAFMADDGLKELIVSYGAGAIWFAYLMKSVRVRNTYWDGLPPQPAASASGAGSAPKPRPAPPGASDASRPADIRLRELKVLLDQGLITAKDYEAKKAAILQSL